MLKDDRALKSLLGEKTAKAFEKQLGITTAAQLLLHFPRRYSKRGELTTIASLPVGESVTVVGEVLRTTERRIRGRKGSILEVELTDGTSVLTLAFFNQAWRAKELHVSARGLFSGKTGIFGGKLQLTHPDYELFETDIAEAEAEAWAKLPIPIYPASAALSTWKIQKSVAIILDANPDYPELLPESLLSKRGLIGLSEAIKKIHQPLVDADYLAARESLKFHEAMLLHLRLKKSKLQHGKTIAQKRTPGRLLELFDKRLGFQLTAGQKRVAAEIASDMASGTAMHRLLQGEVGSGKTVLALRAMLAAAEDGGQSALLAPTEVLASQHARSISEALGPELSKELGLTLLTGSMPQADRKRALLDITSSKAKIVIGTHALLGNAVTFYDLALVVIDEQHRFGVRQRETIRAKSETSPHVLVMTATPIPRTLAITVFGDLEISSLTELPAGRTPISTHVVPVTEPALVARVWQRVAEEVSSGRQAFVVCPRIEPGVAEEAEDELDVEGPPPANATDVFEALGQNPSLKGLRLGLVHGRLPVDEKALAMQKFSSGELDVLVATTVIEVGVNVPNATVMVILDADRFGIAQLHQLRGRVGRGSHPGLCLMISAAESETVAGQRLAAVASTNDGFVLSEIDLELRREGDVLGEGQSGGKSALHLLRVTKDQELILETNPIAQALLDEGLGEQLELMTEPKDALALGQS